MKIAVLQMTSGIDPAANAAVLCQAVADARAAGADLLFTPEMSGMLDRNRARAAATIRDEADDFVLAAVREAAADHKIWVNIGSLAIAPSDGKWRNRGFVIDASGAIVARYDKMHLFDVTLDSGESWRESAVYTGGEAPVIANTPFGRVGLTICYDMRFSVLYQRLSDAGAQILSVPAAFTRPTGEAHWHILLRARAIESTCFVVAAAQTGDHEDGRSTYGHSLVVDPWGEVLLDMGDAPGLGIVDMDLDRVAAVRRQIPSLANRREIGAVLPA